MLFGRRLRTQVLVLVALLNETYPTQIARLLKSRLLPVQRVITLEAQGVLSTRLTGTVRLVTLNPRFFAIAELRDLLLKIGEADLHLAEYCLARSRRRSKESPSDDRLCLHTALGCRRTPRRTSAVLRVRARGPQLQVRARHRTLSRQRRPRGPSY